jgi:hypothetical protein
MKMGFLFNKATLGKVTNAMAGATAVLLSASLVACGASSYSQELLDEADGIKVVAENAGNDQSAVTAGALDVEEGDVITISPFTDKGSFHLTITESGADEPIYDDDVDGKVIFSIDADPGSYDVKTSGNGVTGWMTVFSENKEEQEAVTDQLVEKLAENGVEWQATDDADDGKKDEKSDNESDDETDDKADKEANDK